MHKLSVKVSEKLSKSIATIRIDKDISKGQTLRFLVELAVANADVEPDDFGVGEFESCTLTVGDKFYLSTKEYRKKHGLTAKTTFFKDALARGVTVYNSS